jgi:hypothetical protein
MRVELLSDNVLKSDSFVLSPLFVCEIRRALDTGNAKRIEVDAFFEEPGPSGRLTNCVVELMR